MRTRVLRRTCTCTTLLGGVCQISYCDHDVRASLLGFFVACDCIRAGHSGSRTDCLLPDTHLLRVQTCLVTHGSGQASSWYNSPAKQHTKNCYSGWSKRDTRGYHSDNDDLSRQWEDRKPSDFMESLNFYTLSIPDESYCFRSGAQNSRRNFCSVVASRLG